MTDHNEEGQITDPVTGQDVGEVWEEELELGGGRWDANGVYYAEEPQRFAGKRAREEEGADNNLEGLGDDVLADLAAQHALDQYAEHGV